VVCTNNELNHTDRNADKQSLLKWINVVEFVKNGEWDRYGYAPTALRACPRALLAAG
jgi:hypothetical protein